MNKEDKVPWKWSFYVRAILFSLLAVLLASIVFCLICFMIYYILDDPPTIRSFLSRWFVDGFGLLVIGMIFLFCAPPAVPAGIVLGRLLHVDAHRGRLTSKRSQWIGAGVGFTAGIFATVIMLIVMFHGGLWEPVTAIFLFIYVSLPAALTGNITGNRLARMYQRSFSGMLSESEGPP